MASAFQYHRPRSVGEATAALALTGARPMGGGTDLLVALDEGFETADLVVDLRELPASQGIASLDDGSIRIGAATRIDDIAADPLIVDRYPALAQACGTVGTPALRQMGTIGENLCQRPHCWYLRRDVACLKNGGDTCPAVDGENQYHAILGAGPCY